MHLDQKLVTAWKSSIHHSLLNWIFNYRGNLVSSSLTLEASFPILYAIAATIPSFIFFVSSNSSAILRSPSIVRRSLFFFLSSFSRASLSLLYPSSNLAFLAFLPIAIPPIVLSATFSLKPWQSSNLALLHWYGHSSCLEHHGVYHLNHQ